ASASRVFVAGMAGVASPRVAGLADGGGWCIALAGVRVGGRGPRVAVGCSARVMRVVAADRAMVPPKITSTAHSGSPGAATAGGGGGGPMGGSGGGEVAEAAGAAAAAAGRNSSSAPRTVRGRRGAGSGSAGRGGGAGGRGGGGRGGGRVPGGGGGGGGWSVTCGHSLPDGGGAAGRRLARRSGGVSRTARGGRNAVGHGVEAGLESAWTG